MLRLGLDVGTNSIGWCLTENDSRIVAIGVRIFTDGRDPKSGASLAVDRRNARAMRRRRDRYLGRRSAFLKTLIAYGLMPADADEAKLIADQDPYLLRKRALDEALTPYEIGRALFHLNQRRGFLSNRKTERKQKDAEAGKIAIGAERLEAAMEEANARTLGEFLAGRATKRVRMGSDNQEYDFYPQRRHIEAEFTAIWSAQTPHHPNILTEPARAALHRILFFQRPLKEQIVGPCTFAGYPGIPADEKRLPKAHPLFQERRLYEEVNHLRIVSPGAADRLLTLDQRDKLVVRLREKKKVSFDSLANFLNLAEGERFNKASETRKELAGNEVYAELRDKKRFGATWTHFSLDEQWAIVERLQNEEDDDKLFDWLETEYNITDAAIATAIANTPLPEGYGRFGQTLTLKLLQALKENVVTYDEAMKSIGIHHSDPRTGEILQTLPYYGQILTREISPGKAEYGDCKERQYGKITNPTVHIGLRQVEKLVNAIIKVHGRPNEIVVELARELKLNEKQKEEHQRRIRRDTLAAQQLSAKLQEISVQDKGANRALLRAWQELNPENVADRRCPYCANPISIKQLFGSEADIDHIIPYSRSLDDSAGNKIVAHRSCNREKGRLTPYEKWGDTPRWELISAQISRMHKSKQWRFGPDAGAKVDTEEAFIARQLTDTQYLSTITARYLASLYPTKESGSVYVIPGQMTAMLRRLWGLNELLPDHNIVGNAQSNAPKNRLDHRHHAIDAAVTAVTTRGLLMEIARAAGRAEDKNLDRMFEDLPHPWESFRDDLFQSLGQITVSHKPDHGRNGKPNKDHDITSGRLHLDTAYGLTGDLAPDGKTPIVVHRVPFSTLTPKDIADPQLLPDATLRAALQAATAGLSGAAFTHALSRFSKAHPIFKGIRHIRIREALNVIAIRDREGRAYKAYKGGANARYNVWAMPDGSWCHDVVSQFDAHQPGHQDTRPHPAAKKILCLRQNDLVAIERDGAHREIMRVVKFTIKGPITLAGNREGGALADRDKNPNDPFKLYAPGASGLKKLKARQIRIDPLGRVFDPGPRD